MRCAQTQAWSGAGIKQDSGRKRYEPDPPAAADSCAKPTAGGLARKTLYTFFYVNLSGKPCLEYERGEEAHKESVADEPFWLARLRLLVCGKIKYPAEALAVIQGGNVEVGDVNRPRRSPKGYRDGQLGIARYVSETRAPSSQLCYVNLGTLGVRHRQKAR